MKNILRSLVASAFALLMLASCAHAEDAPAPVAPAAPDAAVAPDAAAAAPAALATRFTIYDGTLYNHKPAHPLPGLQPIRFVYTGELWAKGADRAEPDIAYIKEQAAKWPTDRPVALDIEHWPADPGHIDETVRKYIAVADAIREANPGVKFGFYASLPIRNYWAAQPTRRPGGKDHEAQRASRGEGDTDHDRWLKQNTALAAVAAKVDYILPSLYTFYTDQQGWKEYAEQNIQQSKQYGKPVLAVICPVFHDSNRQLHGQPIPGDFWKLHLDTIAAQGVSAVIWSGPGQFDETWEWWAATKAAVEAVAPPAPAP